MIRKIFFLLVLTSFGLTITLPAEPTPAPKSKKVRRTNTEPKATPAPTLASGWSYANGTWTHVDGYKLVRGRVVRIGIQTHKKVPPPPTSAEMDAAMNKKSTPKTPADAATSKAADRDRNLAPRPASQTGTHL
jgi:hypothetical protein